MSARVEVRKLCCSSGEHSALRDVDLTLEPGTTTTLVGASGSGKTTLLRCLAGLLQPSGGQVWFDGREVTRLPAEQRGVGLVFQSYALFPHLSVAENLGFGLEMRGIDATERRKRVSDLADQLGLATLLTRKPSQISGGERQRVALGRALAYKPVLLLLDEPLAALDPNLADTVREVLRQAIERERTTVLLVTHDRADALRLGDRVVLLRQGIVEQIGTPRELYCSPRTEYVAHFFGTGLVLEVTAVGNRATTPFGNITLRQASNGPLRLLLRPEALRVADEGARANIRRVSYEGNRCRVAFTADGLHGELDAPPGRTFSAGGRICIGIDASSVVVLPPGAHSDHSEIDDQHAATTTAGSNT